MKQHNLGFGHSSENNMIRGDKSGSMGSSLFRWRQLQCWNGHKYSMEDGFGITFLPTSDRPYPG
jgi:hypothetical protein